MWGDVGNFLEDAASKAWDVVETAGDIAGYATTIVGMANPAGAILAGFSVATSNAKSSNASLSDAVRENFFRQEADNCRNNGRENGRKSCGTRLGAGEDIFTLLAEIIGPKLQENIENLVDFASTINTKSPDIFTDMAKLTGEQEKVKTSSAALGGILPAIGESMKNVSKA